MGVPIDAAFLHGSITWLGDGDELAATSDADLILVARQSAGLPIGKRLVDGLVLDVSTVERSEIDDASQVLATYHLASSLRSPDLILFDSDGWLTAVQREVQEEFARREWIARRCDAVVERSRTYLHAAVHAPSDTDRAIAWLFGVGVTTHIHLVAGLRNPTVRRRYQATREMLTTMGRPDLYPPLLDLINPVPCSVQRCRSLVQNLAHIFDATLDMPKGNFPFAGDISAVGRVGAIDDSLHLIDTGHPRDTLFWIGVTATRCLQILEAADPDRARLFRPTWNSMLATIGVPGPGTEAIRAAEMQSALTAIRRSADELIELVAVD